MSSAKQDPWKLSLCWHIRKFPWVLFHRAKARERVKPQASPAALRTSGTLYPAAAAPSNFVNYHPLPQSLPKNK